MSRASELRETRAARQNASFKKKSSKTKEAEVTARCNLNAKASVASKAIETQPPPRERIVAGVTTILGDIKGDIEKASQSESAYWILASIAIATVYVLTTSGG